MQLSWIDWFRYVLTPLIIAAFTALISTRNARKTPHERLKNLVDIQDKIPAGLDEKNIIQGAIARELVDFDRRIAADQRGWIAGIKERLAQGRGSLGNAFILIIGPMGIAALLLSIAMRDHPEAGPVKPLAFVFGIAAFIATLFSFVADIKRMRAWRAWKGVRASRSLEIARLIAESKAVVPADILRTITGNGRIALSPNSDSFDIFSRMAEAGLFKRLTVDGTGHVLFVLTEFGRDVWESDR